MLSHDDSKIKDRKLILLARFNPDFSCGVLVPEIELNSIQYHVDTHLVNNFKKYQHSKNCLYFFHGCAYADIPVGQEYQAIMRINRGVIEPDSVMKCKATALCFFQNSEINQSNFHGMVIMQFVKYSFMMAYLI